MLLNLQDVLKLQNTSYVSKDQGQFDVSCHYDPFNPIRYKMQRRFKYPEVSTLMYCVTITFPKGAFIN